MSIKITNLEPMEPGNPFLQDFISMGTYIGSNVVIFHPNFSGGEHHQKHITVINTQTGERVKLEFTSEKTAQTTEDQGYIPCSKCHQKECECIR